MPKSPIKSIKGSEEIIFTFSSKECKTYYVCNNERLLKMKVKLHKKKCLFCNKYIKNYNAKDSVPHTHIQRCDNRAKIIYDDILVQQNIN